MLSNNVKGANCTELFKAAYQNRYTWDSDFLTKDSILSQNNSTAMGSTGTTFILTPIQFG